MLKRLQNKFVLITMAIVVGMLAIILGLIFHFTAKDMEETGNRALQSLTQSLQHPGGNPGNVQLPYFIMEVYLDGSVVAKGHTYYDLTDEKLLLDLAETVLRQDNSRGKLAHYSLLYSRMPGMGRQVLVFVDVSGQQAALRSMVEVSLAIAAFSLLAFWGISVLLARWAVKPVEKAWQQQKQFVSDASHELKTPLTVIMSNAELLDTGETGEERLRPVGNILAASLQMRSLVEGLLELARADNGQIRRSFERICMSQVAEEAAMLLEAPLYARGRTLETRIQPGIYLKGNAQYLKQVVDILLDNAGKYGVPGIVTLNLVQQGRFCLLSVSNPGQPIPDSQRERLFERFYRADTARGNTGSFGLGLSIAKSVVQEHGGRIWVESNPTGNCFFVRLPCEQP